MGDQWDWIEGYCDYCGTAMGNTGGRCKAHTDRIKFKTKAELAVESKTEILLELEQLISDIKFVQNPDDSKDDAKRLFTLIQKINEL